MDEYSLQETGCQHHLNQSKDSVCHPFCLHMCVVLKVSDWLEVCTKLEQTLGEKDPVLKEWRGRLNNLKKGLPLLLQLSSKYLRVSGHH